MPPDHQTRHPRVSALFDPARLEPLRRDRQSDRARPGTEFDSSDPDELVRRLDASDCFCRDSKVGRLYHLKQVSFRELTARDSLHVTFRPDRTVSAHIDRRSPLARHQPGGACRYSPLRIVAHNITGALNDVLRLTIGRRPSTADYLVDQLVDDRAVSETVTDKEVGHADGLDRGAGTNRDGSAGGREGVTAGGRRDDTGELQAVGRPASS